MTSLEPENLAIIYSYLNALETGVSGEALSRYFAPEAVQVELPNRLNPTGAQSDLATMLKRAEQGKKLLLRQSYEIRSAVAQGQNVAVEATWNGVLAVPLSTMAAGATMKAHFAMFFELRNGLICSQRNYDCFEPW
jgi:ketosteroid isomerase-like protein